MTDILTPQQRSHMMSRVKNRDTKIETMIRSLLHRRGFRFRKNASDLPGRPDITLPKYKAVILVHGCFWHGHTCNKGKLPSTRLEFWSKKIAENQGRDKYILSQLHNSGWRIAVVWECSLRNKTQQVTTIEQLCNWINSDVSYFEVPNYPD
ncbi:very short patch repair endonuclease [Chloroflexota bacterium]